MSVSAIRQELLLLSREEALEFQRMLKDAEDGDVNMQYVVGMSYLEGLDGIKDEAKGVAWLELAAAQDCPAAQRELALLLQKGESLPQDQVRAFALLCHAAEAGNGLACYYRAKALLEGCGVARNFTLGKAEMELVAGDGWPEAQAYLQDLNLSMASAAAPAG